MADNITFGQYSRSQNAISQFLFGTDIVKTDTKEYQDTDTVVAIGMIVLPGPGKIKVVRSAAQKAAFLKQLAANGKSPKWMNNWLRKGKVPPGHNVDHVKPLSIGGADNPSNMRLITTADHIIHHRFYRPWKK